MYLSQFSHNPVHHSLSVSCGLPCTDSEPRHETRWSRLWQRYVGWFNDLPTESPPVCSQRCSSAAQLIAGLHLSDHATDTLASFHWLRAPERIDFKLAVLVYRALHGTAPRYLSDLFRRVADLQSRNHMDVSYEKLFSGHLPTRIMIGLVDNRAYNGDLLEIRSISNTSIWTRVVGMCRWPAIIVPTLISETINK